jgi:hypothetical protein
VTEKIADPARALRLARAVLSDVMLYNSDKVREGIEADDLFDRLREELAEARAYFDERVAADVATKTNAFGLAVVDILIYRSRAVRSRIW